MTTLAIIDLKPGQHVIGQWLNHAGQPIVEFPARLVHVEPMITGICTASLAIQPAADTAAWETVLVFAGTTSGPWRTDDGTEFTVRAENMTPLREVAEEIDAEDPEYGMFIAINALGLDPEQVADDMLIGEDDRERVLNAALDGASI